MTVTIHFHFSNRHLTYFGIWTVNTTSLCLRVATRHDQPVQLGQTQSKTSKQTVQNYLYCTSWGSKSSSWHPLWNHMSQPLWNHMSQLLWNHMSQPLSWYFPSSPISFHPVFIVLLKLLVPSSQSLFHWFYSRHFHEQQLLCTLELTCRTWTARTKCPRKRSLEEDVWIQVLETYTTRK